MVKPIDKKLEKLAEKETYRLIKDGSIIDVGGEDDTTFVPEVHSSKWGGECWFKISHKDKDKIKKNKKAEENIKDGKLEIEVAVDGTGRKHKFREGSLEWDIEYATIDDLPDDDIERFQLEFPYDQLTFYHQPELTQEEIDLGAERPENIINSYAGYFNKSNNEYETGKFCHIYRSKLIANDGAEIWATQEIVGTELLVHIPRQWMIDHGFGILDPNIGYTSVGASNFNNDSDRYRAFKATSTPGSNGTIDSISIYVHDSGQTAGKLAVYDDDTDYPDALVYGSAEMTIGNGSQGWYVHNVSGSPSVVSGTQYWNTVWTDGFLRMRYDAGSSTYKRAVISYGTLKAWEDPFPAVADDLDFIYSQYFTYTEAAGGSRPLPQRVLSGPFSGPLGGPL